MEPLLALFVTFVLMWVLLIRPQQRRLRQHQAVVASLEAGDEVVTAGGIYGTVRSVDDEAMILEVAPGIELKVLRAAVSQRVGPVEEDEDDDQADEEADGLDDADLELEEAAREDEPARNEQQTGFQGS